MSAFKLNYKIVGRRKAADRQDWPDIDCVDVEWSHADGDFPDGRTVVKDQVNVGKDTPDSIVMQLLEEKRQRLAANLGVEP